MLFHQVNMKPKQSRQSKDVMETFGERLFIVVHAGMKHCDRFIFWILSDKMPDLAVKKFPSEKSVCFRYQEAVNVSQSMQPKQQCCLSE